MSRRNERPSRRFARKHGFLDPTAPLPDVAGRLEVGEPLEHSWIGRRLSTAGQGATG